MAATNQVFSYEGTDKSGRKITGDITSTNANIAKAELRKQGINPTKVKKKSAGFSFSMGQKIKPGDIALFTRQLATMMKAGVPLVQSFEIVADGVDNATLKDMILKIRDDVSAGNSFTSAIRGQPDYFDDLFCNLIEAGEQSGLELGHGELVTNHGLLGLGTRTEQGPHRAERQDACQGWPNEACFVRGGMRLANRGRHGARYRESYVR